MSSVSTEQTFATNMQLREVVYFTPQNLEILSETKHLSSHTSIQLVSLPREYSNEDAVRKLFQEVLYIGEVSNIRIIERKNYNQRLRTDVVTKTAFVDFVNWNNTSATTMLDAFINPSSQSKYTQSVTGVLEEAIHWENGDPMTHLSLREAKIGSGSVPSQEKSGSEPNTLALEESDWTSLYIPILPSNMTITHPDHTTNTFQPKYLKSFIENDLKLGKVQRVDFIDRELEDSQVVKSVFIHFESWNNNSNAKFLRDKLNNVGQFKQKGYYDGRNMHNLSVLNENGDKVPGYFVFKINYKPIPDVSETELNMSQLVAANKVLEEKMVERDELIAKLTAELDELREKQNMNQTA